MVRLLKLVALGVLGYAAFEFIRGWSGSPARRADQDRKRIGEGSTRAAPTGQVLASTPMPTGGMEVTTGDVAGSSFRHRVGRGIVSKA